MEKLYGNLQSEVVALENMKCRQIVTEITNFGVNDRQIMMIIYLLSLNLEDGEKMREISSLIRTLEETLFISDMSEDGKKGIFSNGSNSNECSDGSSSGQIIAE